MGWMGCSGWQKQAPSGIDVFPPKLGNLSYPQRIQGFCRNRTQTSARFSLPNTHTLALVRTGTNVQVEVSLRWNFITMETEHHGLTCAGRRISFCANLILELRLPSVWDSILKSQSNGLWKLLFATTDPEWIKLFSVLVNCIIVIILDFTCTLSSNIFIVLKKWL